MTNMTTTENDLTYPPTCILTGADGENPDDCTTHDHEEMLDLSALAEDGDTLALPDGRTLRLKVEHDEFFDPYGADLEPDMWGKVAFVEGDSGPFGGITQESRPAGFDGAAEIIEFWQGATQGGYTRMWWQPPSDVERGSEAFVSIRDALKDLLAFGAYMITVEILDGHDAYRRPIVRGVANLGAVESVADGSLAEIVAELVAEVLA